MKSLSERYRPQTIDEIVGQTDLKHTLNHYLDTRRFGHVLLYGPTGTGKTSAVIAFARELFGKSFTHNFKELNASDNRGIEMVRSEIKQWASTQPRGQFPYKVLLLDEIEGMTPDAQHALRRTMEKMHSCRFFATTNHPEKIIGAIKSRMVRIHVPKLGGNEVVSQLSMVCQEEEIRASNEVLISIVEMVDGDMRQAMMYLEGIPEDATPEFIYNMNPTPDIEKVRQMLNVNVHDEADFNQRWAAMKEVQHAGVDTERVFDLMFKEFLGHDNPVEQLDCVGEYHWRLVKGGNPEMILWCCLERLRQIEGFS